MRATDEGAQKDGEEQQIAEDSDGPCPYFASHAAQRRCQAERVAEDFAHEEGLVPHVDLCVEEPPQNVHDSFLSCVDVFRMRGCASAAAPGRGTELIGSGRITGWMRRFRCVGKVCESFGMPRWNAEYSLHSLYRRGTPLAIQRGVGLAVFCSCYLPSRLYCRHRIFTGSACSGARWFAAV